MNPSVLAFDMNGTLLDTGSLEAKDLLGSPERRREWFSELVAQAMTATLTDAFENFAQLGESALEVVFLRHGAALASERRRGVLERVREMPPFPDVRPGLERLQGLGLRLAVLTNSSARSAEHSLERAGLLAFFEKILSAEAVRRYKPSAQVYGHAADVMGVEPGSLMLVAAHDWDTTGAIRAGCQAAFLGRPGEVLNGLAPRPQLIVATLDELAVKLKERGRGGEAEPLPAG